MTKEIEHIKAMIESVDPDDTQTLDEIDATVFFTLNPKERVYFSSMSIKEYLLGVRDQHYSKVYKNYTRSIDAQKDLELEGWFVYCDDFDSALTEFSCTCWSKKDEVSTPRLPNEELARLYCWLCVRQWEIENE